MTGISNVHLKPDMNTNKTMSSVLHRYPQHLFEHFDLKELSVDHFDNLNQLVHKQIVLKYEFPNPYLNVENPYLNAKKLNFGTLRG